MRTSGLSISELERRIESVIAQEETSAAKARLLRSIPGIGPVSAAMLIAEMPELGRMTSGEAAAMTGLAPIPHDRGAMRVRRAIAEGRRSLRHVMFQAAPAAACHDPVLKPVAQNLKMRGKPHKFVIVAIARRLVTIANAILKSGVPWRLNPITLTQLLDGFFTNHTNFRRTAVASIQPAPVPLPAAMPMLLVGLGGLTWMRRRKDCS